MIRHLDVICSMQKCLWKSSQDAIAKRNSLLPVPHYIILKVLKLGFNSVGHFLNRNDSPFYQRKGAQPPSNFVNVCLVHPLFRCPARCLHTPLPPLRIPVNTSLLSTVTKPITTTFKATRKRCVRLFRRTLTLLMRRKFAPFLC